MAQVPYTGVTEVASGGVPRSAYRAEISEAAFGGNVAAATANLGKAVQGAGNELFERAVAMQTLYNHSLAQDADAEYMKVAGKLHAEYGVLQGKDAVAGYDKYQKDLDDARKAIGKTLPNDAARKLFDSSTLRTMSSSIFNGASHAAAENKKYALSSLESKISAETDMAATSDNPRTVEQARQNIKRLATERSALKGLDPATAEEYEKGVNSSLDLNVITHTSRTDPIEAQRMLDARRTNMTAADFNKAQTVVENSTRAVGSVNIAKSVLDKHTDDEGKTNVSFSTLQAEAEAEAKRMAPNDPIMQKHTLDALKAEFNQRIYADKQFRWDNIQTVDAGIQNGVKDIQQLRYVLHDELQNIKGIERTETLISLEESFSRNVRIV